MERYCARCGQRGGASTCARDGAPLSLVDGLLGRTAGNYTLVERIGEGGMGEVFRAINPELEAEVAIKVLHAQPTKGADGQRFLIEARAVNRVKHDGVVKIVDGGYVDVGRPYLVMDFLEGRSLADVLGEKQRMPRGLRILDDVLDVVSAAHAVGIVHRDLKPANVFLTSNGRTLVLDFGVAKLLDGSGSITRTGAMVGTPAYMAPEQVQGTNIDGRADLYAVGVMLYEMLVGVRPFVGPTPFAVVQAHIQQPVPRLPPVFPPVVQQVVDIALAKEPARRFQSADEMRGHLARAMEAIASVRELASLVDAPWPIARASRPSLPPPVTEPQTSPPTVPDRPGRPSVPPPSVSSSFGATVRERPSGRIGEPDVTARETPYALSGAADSRLAAPSSKKKLLLPIAAVAIAGGVAAAIAIGSGGGSTSAPRDAAIATSTPDAGSAVETFADSLDDIASTPAGSATETGSATEKGSAGSGDPGLELYKAREAELRAALAARQLDIIDLPRALKDEHQAASTYADKAAVLEKMIPAAKTMPIDRALVEYKLRITEGIRKKVEPVMGGDKGTKGMKVAEQLIADGKLIEANDVLQRGLVAFRKFEDKAAAATAKPQGTKSPPSTKAPASAKAGSGSSTAASMPGTQKHTEADVTARKAEINRLLTSLAFAAEDVSVPVIAYQQAIAKKDYDGALAALDEVERTARAIAVDKAFITKKLANTKTRFNKLIAAKKAVPDSLRTDFDVASMQADKGDFAGANQTLYKMYLALRALEKS